MKKKIQIFENNTHKIKKSIALTFKSELLI